MQSSESLCIQWSFTIPVSQLVLPVGVTGLTVNGNTPTPEPGGAVAMEVVRFEEGGKHTHKSYVWYGKHISTPHAETQRKESVYSQHAHGFHLFLVLLHHQPAKEHSHTSM